MQGIGLLAAIVAAALGATGCCSGSSDCDVCGAPDDAGVEEPKGCGTESDAGDGAADDGASGEGG